MNEPAGWYLRKEAGTIYGPVDLPTLQAWAEDGRVAPEDHLSADQQEWCAAFELEALGMAWLLELEGDSAYGPAHWKAFEGMLAEGALDPPLRLRHQATGEILVLGGAAPASAEPVSRGDTQRIFPVEAAPVEAPPGPPELLAGPDPVPEPGFASEPASGSEPEPVPAPEPEAQSAPEPDPAGPEPDALSAPAPETVAAAAPPTEPEILLPPPPPPPVPPEPEAPPEPGPPAPAADTPAAAGPPPLPAIEPPPRPPSPPPLPSVPVPERTLTWQAIARERDRFEREAEKWKALYDQECGSGRRLNEQLAAAMGRAEDEQLAASAEIERLRQEIGTLQKARRAEVDAASGADPGFLRSYRDLTVNYDVLARQLADKNEELRLVREELETVQADSETRVRLAEDHVRREKTAMDAARRRLQDLERAHTDIVQSYRDMNDRYIQMREQLASGAPAPLPGASESDVPPPPPDTGPRIRLRR